MANKRQLPGILRHGGWWVLLVVLCWVSPLTAGEFKELSSRQQAILQPFAKEWPSF